MKYKPITKDTQTEIIGIMCIIAGFTYVIGMIEVRYIGIGITMEKKVFRYLTIASIVINS